MPVKKGAVTRFHNNDITDNETIGTGGGGPTYNYSTLNTPVFLDSLNIDYTVASTPYTATSDAAGNITGTHISSGSVDEVGNILITFSTDPDPATPIILDSYKVKGIMQIMLDFVLGTRRDTENLGTGNGSQTTFATTLSNTPVAKGQCRVMFKIMGTIYDVWDDGQGNFVHDLISSSSLTYATGALSITFAQPIDDLYQMPLLYTDAATEGRDWLAMLGPRQVRNNVNVEVFTGEELFECVLKNSGLSYKEFHCVGMREFKRVASNLYAHNFNLYKTWGEFEENYLTDGFFNVNSTQTGNSAYSGTTQNYISHPMTPYGDDDMYYWLWANKRRIIMVVRSAGNIYTMFHIGAGRRFSSQSSYNLAGLILAAGNGDIAFTSTSLKYLAYPGFILLLNEQGNFEEGDDIAATYLRFDWINTGQMKKTKDGRILCNPVYMIQFDPAPTRTFMDVDGVYHCPHNVLQSEDLIQDGGKDYVVFQDHSRTTYSDYLCILWE